MLIDCLDKQNLVMFYRTLANAIYYDKCGWACDDFDCSECIFCKNKKCVEGEKLTFTDWECFALIGIERAIEKYGLDENFVKEMAERALNEKK